MTCTVKDNNTSKQGCQPTTTTKPHPSLPISWPMRGTYQDKEGSPGYITGNVTSLLVTPVTLQYWGEIGIGAKSLC